MYVKWFDTVMFYYVILVNFTFCHFQISRQFRPCMSRRHRGRNPEDRCRHPLEDITGDTARGHRGSAGHVKRRTDPRAVPHGISECSLGLPLVLHSAIPPGRLS
ncbi:unnamed protein product, partial [Staurois parvus]